MLEWDGTEITKLLSKAKIREAVYHKTIYWTITWKKVKKKTKKSRRIREYCIVKNLNHGLIPCLIDEIKPIFGLKKIGTHWAKYDGKNLLFLKVVNDSKGHILSDLTLDKYGFHTKLKEEVCKIFAFRELLGMSKSFESSIIVRLVGNFVNVISFYDPNMSPSQSASVVPNTVLEKWFTETSLDLEVQNLVGINCLEQLAEKLFYWRIELLNVVKKCDPESILFVDEILSRIAVRLQHLF
jgi:hypothetical protein